MKPLFIAALVASLACLGAEPAEAISFSQPIVVSYLDGGVRWASDGGTCLTPAGWDKIDNAFKDLQTTRAEHRGEPSRLGWFVAGGVTGAVVAGIIAGAVYAATR